MLDEGVEFDDSSLSASPAEPNEAGWWHGSLRCPDGTSIWVKIDVEPSGCVHLRADGDSYECDRTDDGGSFVTFDCPGASGSIDLSEGPPHDATVTIGETTYEGVLR